MNGSQIRNLGVLTPTEDGPYFGGLIHSISKVTQKLGIRLYVIQTSIHATPESISAYNHKLSWTTIDAWIILYHAVNQTYLQNLCSLGKPVVLISDDMGNPSTQVIFPDNFLGSKAATEHLIAHGHKRIAFVGCFALRDIQLRYEGYQAALEQHNIAVDNSLVFNAIDAVNNGGLEAAKKIIQLRDPVTAIVAGCDLNAVGLMDLFQLNGIQVPHDIAITGFDNMEIARTINLTTINVDLDKLAEKTVYSILDKLDQKDPVPSHIQSETDLIIRSSCGCECTSYDNLEIQATAEQYNRNLENLKNVVYSTFGISHQLVNGDIKTVTRLKWLKGNIKIACLALFNHSDKTDANLFIEDYVQINDYQIKNVQRKCTIEDFPPSDFLDAFHCFEINDIIWIHPIETENRTWGAISTVCSFEEWSLQLNIDSWHRIVDLLAFTLEREFLAQEIHMRETQLIQSEKMSALGRLVAGITHEVNTPLGISISATSNLITAIKDFNKLYQSNKVTKKDMDLFLQTLMDSSEISFSNIQKAAELISSFKRVSSDQSSEIKRNFNLKEYIHTTLQSLKPRLKQAKHSINISGEDDIEINSYPGVFSQIITNLTMNSLIHGYDNEITGNLHFFVHRQGDEIIFIYSDDGKGIPKENLDKIFDPYFTTNSKGGGTGLGLNIIYNIVTMTLKGSIQCESTLGKGTTFTISFKCD